MIDIYVNEIRRALRHQCYFPALALALALPDICGMAEFPGLNVTDRYIAWYDKYLGTSTARSGQFDDTPYLSGEVVYNLRNTYLHQGSPSVQRDKVREEVNQIDRFILVLGDGAGFRETSFSMRMSSAETGIVYLRRIYVEVTYLCNILCEGALRYYKRNREKFQFDFSILPQEALLGEDSPLTAAARMGDRLAGLGMADSFGRQGGFGTQENAEKPLGGGQSQRDGTPHSGGQSRKDGATQKSETPEPHENPAPVAEKPEKARSSPVSRETQRLRCFFGEHFKEEKYREKRDDIISAVLSAKSKQQLNNSLMKLFPGEDVTILLQRLEPQIKDLPPSDQKQPQEQEKSQNQKKLQEQENSQEQEKKQDKAVQNADQSGKGNGAKETPTNKERKIRSFFEGNFKEKKYQKKREDIIRAVLTAPSKQQLNNHLMKLFPGEDVKIILKRFKEQIKDLPGK